MPPAIRAKMETIGSDDKKHKDKIDRLKKQLKGVLLDILFLHQLYGFINGN